MEKISSMAANVTPINQQQQAAGSNIVNNLSSSLPSSPTNKMNTPIVSKHSFGGSGVGAPLSSAIDYAAMTAGNGFMRRMRAAKHAKYVNTTSSNIKRRTSQMNTATSA